MKPGLYFILLVFLSYLQVSAQQADLNPIVELTLSNDMTYFTDHYFSNGINLAVYTSFMAKSPLNKILVLHRENSKVYYALTFTHNMYTPIYFDTISKRSIDHPFAAYFLVGNRKESYTLSQRVKVISELQLGVIGSMAGGQAFQNTMHNYIPFAGPVEGWENQIKNDFCFQYSASLEKGIADVQWMELNLVAGGKLGNPHSEAQLGMYCRLGYFDDYFQHIGINSNREWQLWIFCAGDVNLIAHNAVLQGGMFNRSSSYSLQTINHILWHTRFGGTLVYKNIKLEMAQEVTSPSFPTGLWHRWAYLKLMIGF
jgi:hypothetical protein